MKAVLATKLKMTTGLSSGLATDRQALRWCTTLKRPNGPQGISLLLISQIHAQAAHLENVRF